MLDELDACIAAFGRAPRRIGLWDRHFYLQVDEPSWLKDYPDDKLNTLFQHVRRLFTDGVVVWGHVVQANSRLFEAGDDDCPGELLYSLTDRPAPEYLQGVAGKLFSLKGTKPQDWMLSEIADYLTDERIRVFGLPVPREVSPTSACRISTTMFVRKHLPGRVLASGLLPTIVLPVEPHIALPLPAKYWPPSLLDRWTC